MHFGRIQPASSGTYVGSCLEQMVENAMLLSLNENSERKPCEPLSKFSLCLLWMKLNLSTEAGNWLGGHFQSSKFM
jgi:hypothetical protein